MAAASLLNLQQSRLAKDPQVLRDAVVRCGHELGDLGDVARRLDQQADDADAGAFAERAEGDDAVAAVRDGCGAGARGQPIELSGLRGRRGICHRHVTLKIAQS